MAEKILVVDDEPHIREMLVRFLTGEGYHLITAANGLEALQRVELEHPDLILLDISMPAGPNGYEVCEQLKDDEKTALIPITFLTALGEIEQRRRGVDAGGDDYLTKPVNQELLRARVRSQLRSKRLIDQLERTESVVFMLARAVEAKDHHTSRHLWRMAHYSSQLAVALGLLPDDVSAVRYGAILHDIGKIRISESILSKPGPLTPKEFAQIKRHPEYGAEIISHMRFAERVVPIVLGHHEQWDGGGYPQGLRHEAIPLGARIVSIVDAYDAMTVDRPYRQALTQQEAVRRLRARAGCQWDPELVELFCSLVEEQKLTAPPLDNQAPLLEKYMF